MKLADLPYPLAPEDVHYFTMMNKYGAMEVNTKTNIPNVVECIHRCLNELKSKSCIEFCFHEIRYKYKIMEDEHEWTISLIGFMKLN